VAEPAQNLEGDKMFDFRRATVHCSGYHLSKHKMTRYAPAPPGYAYAMMVNPDVDGYAKTLNHRKILSKRKKTTTC